MILFSLCYRRAFWCFLFKLLISIMNSVCYIKIVIQPLITNLVSYSPPLFFFRWLWLLKSVLMELKSDSFCPNNFYALYINRKSTLTFNDPYLICQKTAVTVPSSLLFPIPKRLFWIPIMWVTDSNEMCCHYRNTSQVPWPSVGKASVFHVPSHESIA